MSRVSTVLRVFSHRLPYPRWCRLVLPHAMRTAPNEKPRSRRARHTFTLIMGITYTRLCLQSTGALDDGFRLWCRIIPLDARHDEQQHGPELRGVAAGRVIVNHAGRIGRDRPSLEQP